ncbi:hypothetical protein J4733_20900 [Klebsiella pneumoniae]|uniref:Uncharacterized protein n=1 Tax=Klebsiella pneumoniae TaxID=573 RepID=A0A939SS08_KLEPN|nr:hypothetical protein [Klebsiella pneumoniae]
MAETTFTLWRQRWLWHCRSLLQPCVADDLSVSDVLYTDVMGLPAYYVGLMFGSPGW